MFNSLIPLALLTLTGCRINAQEEVHCNPNENDLIEALGYQQTNEEYKTEKRSLLHNRQPGSCFHTWFQPPFYSLSLCNSSTFQCECTPGTEMDSNGICHPAATSVFQSPCKFNRWNMYFTRTIGPMVALMAKLESPQTLFNAVYYSLLMEYRYIESHLGVPADAQDACMNSHYFLECVMNVTTADWRCGKCFSRDPYFVYEEDRRPNRLNHCVAQKGSVCLLKLYNIGESLNQDAPFVNTSCADALECLPVPNLDFKGRMDLWICGGQPWKVKATSAAGCYDNFWQFNIAMAMTVQVGIIKL